MDFKDLTVYQDDTTTVILWNKDGKAVQIVLAAVESKPAVIPRWIVNASWLPQPGNGSD